MTTTMTTTSRLIFRLLAAAAVAAPCAALAQAPTPEAIVDAMQALSGKHKARASGAKGQCVAGAFTPSKDAPRLSKSGIFAKADVPVLARFSMGGGNPAIADSTKPVTRGFALRIDPDGDTSEFVVISAPVFGARTPEQMFGNLSARVPGPDGKPDAEKIKAFVASNPEVTRQGAWLNAKPIPASYASVSYWGVHAYTLTDAAGKATVVKLKFAPKGGEAGLTDDEAKAKGKDFYIPELTERLAKGPAAFDLMAILGEAGDPTNDVTAMWPEDQRKTVTLGVVNIDKIEENAACDAQTFDPTILADGVAGPKDDPMFEIRSPAYAVSVSRRVE